VEKCDALEDVRYLEEQGGERQWKSVTLWMLRHSWSFISYIAYLVVRGQPYISWIFTNELIDVQLECLKLLVLNQAYPAIAGFCHHCLKRYPRGDLEVHHEAIVGRVCASLQFLVEYLLDICMLLKTGRFRTFTW
jgi:hypothetical protein